MAGAADALGASRRRALRKSTNGACGCTTAQPAALSRCAAGRLAPSDPARACGTALGAAQGVLRAACASAASGLALEARLACRAVAWPGQQFWRSPRRADPPPLPLSPSAPQDGTDGAATGEEVAPAEPMSKNPQDQFMDVVDKAQASIPPEKYSKKVRGRRRRRRRTPPAARLSCPARFARSTASASHRRVRRYCDPTGPRLPRPRPSLP